jgi:putative inorganic carbon (HCO3(-)) transporter
MTFPLFLIMLISYFLRLPARMELLADLRLDLLLFFAVVAAFLFEGHYAVHEPITPSGTALLALCGYIVVTFPFTQWPGSVLTNLQIFSRALLFYLVPACVVTSHQQLRILLGAFLGTQAFRVAEPLYLHLTQGYWGSATHAGEGEMVNRLAGSPHDVINSNGLAFLITTIIGMAYFVLPRKGRPAMQLLYLGGVGTLLYALVLTQSRTGYLALLVILALIVVRSEHKGVGLAIIAGGLVVLVSLLDVVSLERIESIYRTDVRFAGTAHGRIEGMFADLKVGLAGPIFGYGLGTSGEANFNIRGSSLPAHNLYLEVLSELGILGVILFIWYMYSVAHSIHDGLRVAQASPNSAGAFTDLFHALDTWFWMNILFSFLSYGLSSYEWYLMGGLAVAVCTQLAQPQSQESAEVTPSAAQLSGA